MMTPLMTPSFTTSLYVTPLYEHEHMDMTLCHIHTSVFYPIPR